MTGTMEAQRFFAEIFGTADFSSCLANYISFQSPSQCFPACNCRTKVSDGSVVGVPNTERTQQDDPQDAVGRFQLSLSISPVRFHAGFFSAQGPTQVGESS